MEEIGTQTGIRADYKYGLLPNPVDLRGPGGVFNGTGKLADALAKAQAEFKTVPKSKTAKGEKFSYKYADLNDVLGMVVPILAKHGIAFFQPIRRIADKMYVVTRIQLGNEVLEDDGLPVPTQLRPQEMGTYITYAKRYGVSSFLGIAADEDTDAVETRPDFKPENKPSASEQPPAKRGRPPAPKQATPPEKEAPAPQPTENVHGLAVTDNDVPEIIGDKPTQEQRKEYQSRLKAYIALSSTDKVKAFVNSAVGGESTTNLSIRQWESILKTLDEAKANNKLDELLK